MPSRIISRQRRVRKPALRSVIRRATRNTIRVRWRAPDELGFALACYRRAIRAHRRLARLAPRSFDSAVIERERRDLEARRRWHEMCEAALAKVYGGEPRPLSDLSEPLPVLSPRKQQAVERELASWQMWRAAGHDALQRSQLRNPHELVDFGRVVTLYGIAFDFARLAVGLDSAQPPAEPFTYDTALQDLHRIYGDGSSDTFH